MNELLQQIVLFVYGIWRKRWYALATTMVVSLVGLAVVWTIPNSYEATARISLDTESLIAEVLGQGIVEVNLVQKLQVMRQTLISRPNLEKVIRRSGLDVLAATDEEIENLIAQLADDIEITDEGNNIYRFTYSAGFSQFDDLQNAEMSARVVQNLLQIIDESNIGSIRQDVIEAERVLGGQIEDRRRELNQLERRRTEFEQRNIGLVGSGTSYANRLIAARENLSTTEAQLGEAQLVRDELARQLEDVPQFVYIRGQVGPAFGVGLGGGSDLLGRIALLEEQMDALRLRDYTDRHPDVVIVQRQIDNLRERYLEEQAARDELSSDEDGGMSSLPQSQVPNPVYEQTQIRLIEKNGEIASLTGRRAQQLSVLRNLEEQAKNLPVLEAEQSSINREYELIRGRLDLLLGSQEELRLSKEVGATTGTVTYDIVDPPIQPLAPSSPNRPLLLSGVLIASIGAGVALAFILNQALTTFVSARNLRDTFALPVLGSISAIISRTEKIRHRKENQIFAIAYGVLFIVFGVLITLEVARGPTV